MNKKQILFKVLDNFESYACQFLLAFFVVLLFLQILLREFFHYSISWGEELATYLFVWFVFLGASYACRLGAHNRVTFQFKMLPKKISMAIEALSDLIWIGFNIYFIYLSYKFVFVKMNLFWKSQTMGIPMKYFYMILPFAFALMAARVIQINYMRFVRGEEIKDPDAIDMDEIEETMKADGGSENDTMKKQEKK
ncbi:MAG: TRAP transporter small permease [Desulfobacterales bacterium]|nr:TRAP transporter small permease [Desulfobacterales bacterium]